MFQGAYSQYSLAKAPPSGTEPGTVVTFEVTLGTEDGRISLKFEQVGAKGQPYIAIEQDSIVEIILKGDQLYFSKLNDAITTKDELAFYYGGIEYEDYVEGLDRYKKVKFIARFNRGGKYGTVHAFNLNVDLLQSKPGVTPAEWVSLTIDPDITNPPPKVG